MNVATQVILPLVLAFMMFSMGLDLKKDDFKNVAKYPKAFALGLILQLLSLPLLAFAIAKFMVSMGANPLFAAGLIIIAACPGGVTSNMMTHIARADSALSVSLTAVTSLASVFTLPIVAHFGISHFTSLTGPADFPVGKIVIGVFAITTIPVILGMILNAIATNWASNWEPKFRKAASIMFIVVILAALTKDLKLAIQGFSDTGAMVLMLNLGAMAIAVLMSKLASLPRPQEIAIAYECGFQNGTMAIFISLSLLNNEMMMLPGAIYGLTMFVTGGLYFFWLQKKKKAAVAMA